MKVIYDITASSWLEIDKQKTYQEKTTQQWEVEMRQHENKSDYELGVKLIKYPETNAWETRPLHDLMNIILRPTEKLQLTIQKDGLFKEIINQKEILLLWENCKTEIINKYGESESIEELIEKLNDTYQTYSDEIRRSAFFLILFMAWQRKSKRIFNTKSVINTNDNVSVKIDDIRKEETGDETNYTYSGTGELENYNSTKKLYDTQIKPVAKADFDYAYNMNIQYTFEGKGFFKNASMNIVESASEGYIYNMDIAFNLLSKQP